MCIAVKVTKFSLVWVRYRNQKGLLQIKVSLFYGKLNVILGTKRLKFLVSGKFGSVDCLVALFRIGFVNSAWHCLVQIHQFLECGRAFFARIGLISHSRTHCTKSLSSWCTWSWSKTNNTARPAFQNYLEAHFSFCVRSLMLLIHTRRLRMYQRQI